MEEGGLKIWIADALEYSSLSETMSASESRCETWSEHSSKCRVESLEDQKIDFDRPALST